MFFEYLLIHLNEAGTNFQTLHFQKYINLHFKQNNTDKYVQLLQAVEACNRPPLRM